MKKKLLGGAGAAIGIKILTAIAVGAAAITVAGVTTEVALTGSPNPLVWGQQVSQQVAACKASAARLGVHGIGECVSDFANQHGKDVSSSHRASDARGNGDGNSNGNGNGQGKDKTKGEGQGQGQGPGQGHGKPSPKPSETSMLIGFLV